MGTIDRRYGTKLPKWANRDSALGIRYDAATYIGIVKDNIDPARSGRLRVWIPDAGGADEENPSNWRTVSYASPYFGATYQPETNKNNTFDGVNHTYGMWMTPPDKGNQVLCTFVAGDPDRGYWFACVNPTLSHYMVPGLAAGNVVDEKSISDAIKPSILKDSIPPQNLPVVEFNENMPDTMTEKFYNNPKPLHEYQASVLFVQGLDRDAVRGAITSSSQRETPSNVFGISTPGRPYPNDPATDPKYEEKLKAGKLTEADLKIKSRKGGHQFVMDDGDVAGKDQLIRLRTAGGHQILMNDAEGVLYIANDAGTCWLEFGQTGQMHIYSQSGYNVRSEGDINFHAGKNFNLQADGSVNIASGETTSVTGAKLNLSAADSAVLYGGTVNVGSGGTLTVTGSGAATFGGAGAVTVAGDSIDLKLGGGNSITGAFPNKNSHSDTRFDEKTQTWQTVPSAASSIVTVMPTHEPWDRKGEYIAKPQPSTSICPPKAGNPGDYTLPPPNGNSLDKGTVKGQPAPWTTDKAFLDKTKEVAGNIGANYLDLLACMYFETFMSMDPAKKGPGSATGLIQFLDGSARAQGTSTSALADMSRVEQLNYVQKYLNAAKGRASLSTVRLVDLYTMINYPAATGKGTDFPVYGKPGQPGGGTSDQNDAYNGNKNSFDPEGKGYVTVGDFEKRLTVSLNAVKQAMANSGATTQPTPQGNTSPSGNNTTTGEDIGIKNAAGKSVVAPTCPSEYMSKTDTYNPLGGIGDKAPKFTQNQVKAMMCELGYFESKFAYNKVSDDKLRIGKYQVDAEYLAERGYIKPDAIKQYGADTLSKGESWTNKDSINSQQAFFDNKNIQDKIQFEEFKDNYTKLVANKGIKETDDICMAAGMLFVAHQFRSVDKAKEWRDKGQLVDLYKRSGEVYYNHGRYAIDVLSVASTSSSGAPGGLNGANTTGINPDDVMVFGTQGAGSTRERFDATTSEFKTAILTLAKAYKDKTGSKVVVNSTLRTYDEQVKLYKRWQDGDPSVMTPAKPGTSPHEFGVALDSNQSSAMKNMFNVADYGLKWQGSSDPVHLQLINYNKTAVQGNGNTPAKANEGAPLVVLFRGMNPNTGSSKGVDQLYAQLQSAGYTALIYDYAQTDAALTQINAWEGKIALVGFSKGAESIRDVAAAMGNRAVDLLVGADPWVTVNQQYSRTLRSNVKRAYIYYSPKTSDNNGRTYSGPDSRMTWVVDGTSNHAAVMINAVGSIAGLIAGI